MTTTYSELQVHNATNSVRRERDIRINDISWRIERNQREKQCGDQPHNGWRTDDDDCRPLAPCAPLQARSRLIEYGFDELWFV